MKPISIHLIFLVPLCFFILNACSSADYSIEELDSFIKNRMKDKHVSGLSGAIIKGDSIAWLNSYGYANIETKDAMTNEHILNIGSVSKVFTATAIMQLWEKNQIDLNRDISTYLNFDVNNPNYPKDSITIQQLLTHTSSISDGKAYEESYQCGETEMPLKDWLLEYLSPNGKFYSQNENFAQTKPGTKRAYSNIGYGVLGLIVEEVSGVPFNQFCKDNIFSPLGMHHTGWFLNEIDTNLHAKPSLFISAETIDFVKDDDNILQLVSNFDQTKLDYYLTTCLYSFPNYPDGLLRSSPKDLSKFLIAILNDGQFMNAKILEAATIRKMLSPQLDGNEKQGLGWSYTGFEDLWGHGGDDPGIQAGMYFSPSLKIGVIAMQNSNEGSRTELLKNIYLTAKNLN